MLKATVNLRALKAVNRASSTEETRYYLNGVCLEINAERALAVATDGHRLLCHSGAIDGEPEPNTLIGTWIIPAAIIKNTKLGKRDVNGLATLTGDGSRALTLEYDGLKVGFEAIDGVFPDWRRVIGAHEDYDDATRLNSRYLAEMDAAGNDLGLGIASIVMNGCAPAHCIYTGDTLFGVIMPMRQGSYRGVARPSWIESAPVDRAEENAERAKELA